MRPSGARRHRLDREEVARIEEPRPCASERSVLGAPGSRRTRSAGSGGRAAALRGPAMTPRSSRYYRGGDGFAIDRAVIAIARHLEQETGARPGPLAGTGAETSVAALAERVATAPMFGGGTVAVVVDPGPLLRSKDGRERLERILANVAPGNALSSSSRASREQAGRDARRASRARSSGRRGARRRSRRPRAGELAGWLANLARDRGLTLERDASAGAGPPRRRVRDRGRRGPPAPGGTRRRGARQAGALPPGGADHGRGRPGPRPRGDPGLHLGDPRARRGTPDRVAAPLLDRLLETTPLPHPDRGAPPPHPGARRSPRTTSRPGPGRGTS